MVDGREQVVKNVCTMTQKLADKRLAVLGTGKLDLKGMRAVALEKFGAKKA